MIPIMAKRASRRSDATRKKLEASKERPIFQAPFRVLSGGDIVLGPGKTELLGAIYRTSSIAAAAKEMRLSYMRAWSMVRTMNEAFQEPLVQTERGGSGRGGAVLTPLGIEVIRLYREIERVSRTATARPWKQLARRLK